MTIPFVESKRNELKAISNIIYGRELYKVNINDIDYRLLDKIITNNKVPLATINNTYLQNLCNISNSFKKIYTSHMNEYKRQRNIYKILLKEFNNNNIEPILIKSTGHYPYTSDNVDILISEELLVVAREILLKIGYVELKNMEEPYKLLFRKFENGESVYAVHLHTKVAWINPFHDEQQIIKRSKKSKEDELVIFPSQEDCLLINMAHWFYEDKQLKLRDMLHTKYYCKTVLNWDYILMIATRYGWLYGLKRSISTHNYLSKKIFKEEFQILIPDYMESRVKINKKVALPYNFNKISNKLLHFIKIIMSKSNDGIYKELYLFIKYALIAKGIRRTPGFLITFSGLDGSGKSSLINSLTSIYNRSGVNVHSRWCRLGSTAAANKIRKIMKKNDEGNAGTVVNANYSIKTSNNNKLKKIWGIFLITELFFWYLGQFIKAKTKGNVIMLDRYWYDALVDLKLDYSLNVEKNYYIKLLDSLLPKPEISYYLDVDLNKLVERRPEENFDLMNAKERLYSMQKNKFTFIDCNEELYPVVNKITMESINKYFSKW